MSMNLIEKSLQEKFVSVSKQTSSNVDDILKFEPSRSSYYVKYEDSKHLDDVIMEYDFDSPLSLNKYLNNLWKDKEDLKRIVTEIMMNTRKKEERFLEEVQGYNYTL